MRGAGQFPISIMLTISMLSLLAGCGKKASNSQQGMEGYRTPISEIERYLDKQDVNCESNSACPSYITKIVAVNQRGYNICTGILVKDNLIATSTSCLPKLVTNQDCSSDVFFFFPGVNGPERAGCVRMVQSSDIEGADPVLWRDDVTFFMMDRYFRYRNRARISREGLPNQKSFSTWMIDQKDDFLGIIKKQTCVAVHNTYVNPLATHESSPNMVLGNCRTTAGGSGAPIVDGSGKVRGLISKNILQSIKDYILSTKLISNGVLQDMVYGTNFACAPTPFDNETANDAECRKDINETELNTRRGNMLTIESIFGEVNRKFEESLSSVSKFIRFKVELVTEGTNIRRAQVVPKCFKPFKDWVDSMRHVKNTYVDDVNLPERIYQKGMDSYGRAVGLVEDLPKAHTFIQFFMRDIRSEKKSSNITIWTNGSDTHTLSDPLMECSSLL